MKKIAFLIGIISIFTPSLFYSANFPIDKAICKSLLKNLNVDSIPEAQKKIQGLDELLDSLGATTVSDALKHYETVEEQTDRGFNHLAELAGIDVKAITKKAKKEKNPWLLVEPIGAPIIRLKEN